jgi:hypothetical protein
MRKSVKIKTYESIVKPVVVFGVETWAVTEMDITRLGTEERENIKKDIWTGGRGRSIENKN